MTGRHYLGIDLGATSGRAVLGRLEGGTLSLEEIHRFPNAPVEMGGYLVWDHVALWREILESLRCCARRGHREIAGVGVAAWGVDFALLGPAGLLVASPICYRDRHTEGVEETIRATLDEDTLYAITGLPVSRMTSLARLVALERGGARRLVDAADRLLFIPDLFRWMLTGRAESEDTVTTSSQVLDLGTRTWSPRIVEAFDLPPSIFPPVARVGTMAAPLSPEVRAACGLDASVAVIAGHDTLSAAAAVPVTGPDTAFVSCGTWSVMGVLAQRPVTTPQARRLGFVNELGATGQILARNLAGFGLLESLRAQWRHTGTQAAYDELIAEATRASPLAAVVDLNAPDFFAPADPEGALRSWLARSGQPSDLDRGRIVRVLLEGLALSYRMTLRRLESLGQPRVRRISVVGGGARNPLLCTLVAECTGCVVHAGPVEATVAGSIALQAVAAGDLATVEDVRALVARSWVPAVYEPRGGTQGWETAYARYRELAGPEA